MLFLIVYTSFLGFFFQDLYFFVIFLLFLNFLSLFFVLNISFVDGKYIFTKWSRVVMILNVSEIVSFYRFTTVKNEILVKRPDVVLCSENDVFFSLVRIDNDNHCFFDYTHEMNGKKH